MRLLFIRHAIAFPHGTPGTSDDERPLTAEGERKFREAARGLARLVDTPDGLLTSPLLRARQTAHIASEAWRGDAKVRSLEALRDPDGHWHELERALASYPDEATVALVGHEPSFSAVLAKLLHARDPQRLEFRKGGAALVEIPEGLPQGGKLLWFVTPKVLRRLGGQPRGAQHAGSRDSKRDD